MIESFKRQSRLAYTMADVRLDSTPVEYNLTAQAAYQTTRIMVSGHELGKVVTRGGDGVMVTDVTSKGKLNKRYTWRLTGDPREDLSLLSGGARLESMLTEHYQIVRKEFDEYLKR